MKPSKKRINNIDISLYNNLGKEIRDVVMETSFKELADRRVKYPSVENYNSVVRNEKIREQFRGFNCLELAERYGLSTRQIRRIVKGGNGDMRTVTSWDPKEGKQEDDKPLSNKIGTDKQGKKQRSTIIREEVLYDKLQKEQNTIIPSVTSVTSVIDREKQSTESVKDAPSINEHTTEHLPALQEHDKPKETFTTRLNPTLIIKLKHAAIISGLRVNGLLEEIAEKFLKNNPQLLKTPTYSPEKKEVVVPHYIRAKAAESMFGVKAHTFYKWARDKQISYLRVGKVILFDADELADFLTNPTARKEKIKEVSKESKDHGGYKQLFGDLWGKKIDREMPLVVARLKPGQRDVIEKYYIENWSYSEIARNRKRSPSRIYQIRDQAFRSLSHPSRTRLKFNLEVLSTERDIKIVYEKTKSIVFFTDRCVVDGPLLIDELSLSTRADNCLRNMQINDLAAAFSGKTVDEITRIILRTKNCGKKTLAEILRLLSPFIKGEHSHDNNNGGAVAKED